jgi:CRP/FNR family transcriptional regulator, cyclic AMP receptor protein
MTAIQVPRSTLLESLAGAEREALLSSGHTKRWQPGELLVRRGDQADSAIVLTQGLVKIHTTTAEGTEVVLAFSGAGDLLGEVTAVRDARRSANATAMEPVQGVVIAVAALRSFLTRYPAATLALLDMSLRRLHVADVRRMEFATSGSLARVAARLIELAERFGVTGTDGAIEVTLPISQDELASWSASSLESTGRALRTLRGLGLIETSRRRLTVLDLDGLAAHRPRL